MNFLNGLRVRGWITSVTQERQTEQWKHADLTPFFSRSLANFIATRSLHGVNSFQCFTTEVVPLKTYTCRPKLTLSGPLGHKESWKLLCKLQRHTVVRNEWQTLKHLQLCEMAPTTVDDTKDGIIWWWHVAKWMEFPGMPNQSKTVLLVYRSKSSMLPWRAALKELNPDRRVQT